MSTAVHIYDSGFQSETVGTPNHKKYKFLHNVALIITNYQLLGI